MAELQSVISGAAIISQICLTAVLLGSLNLTGAKLDNSGLCIPGNILAAPVDSPAGVFVGNFTKGLPTCTTVVPAPVPVAPAPPVGPTPGHAKTGAISGMLYFGLPNLLCIDLF